MASTVAMYAEKATGVHLDRVVVAGEELVGTAEEEVDTAAVGARKGGAVATVGTAQEEDVITVRTLGQAHGAGGSSSSEDHRTEGDHSDFAIVNGQRPLAPFLVDAASSAELFSQMTISDGRGKSVSCSVANTRASAL